MNEFLINDFSIELNELLQSGHHRVRVEKGGFLFQEGMLMTEMYIVQSGKVRVSKVSADGKELSLSICTEGDIVNELPLYTNNTNHLLTASVLEDSEVLVITKEKLEKLLQDNSNLAFEYMKWLSDYFRNTQTKFRDLMFFGKKGALYSTIIRLTNKYGIQKKNGDIVIEFPLNNSELALFCGTSRETVSRMLTDLRGEGILSKSNGIITVHSLNHLKDEILCENCPAEFCSI